MEKHYVSFLFCYFFIFQASSKSAIDADTFPIIVCIEINAHDGQHLCAGILIDMTHVLSAANCVHGHPIEVHFHIVLLTI